MSILAWIRVGIRAQVPQDRPAEAGDGQGLGEWADGGRFNWLAGAYGLEQGCKVSC